MAYVGRGAYNAYNQENRHESFKKTKKVFWLQRSTFTYGHKGEIKSRNKIQMQDNCSTQNYDCTSEMLLECKCMNAKMLLETGNNVINALKVDKETIKQLNKEQTKTQRKKGRIVERRTTATALNVRRTSAFSTHPVVLLWQNVGNDY